MLVLGIESSCDETAAALVEDGRKILSSVITSQVRVHSPFGGVVPELASREHVDNIVVVVDECLKEASIDWSDLDAVAVTRGPGLVGALLVGLTYAKGLAFSLGIPFVGVNHLEGHIYSIFLDHPEAELPALSLVVSGGHTNLYYFSEPGRYELLAKTRDDAAGEAFDKLAKRLGLGYPGGPVIDRLAKLGHPEAVAFTLPKISDQSLDFSFSGLKTAALRYIESQGIAPASPETLAEPGRLSPKLLDLVASYQRATVEQLIDRLQKAREVRSVRSIQVSGGVSCNNELRETTTRVFEKQGCPVYFPRPALTTDNAAMIASAAYHRLSRGESDPWTLSADPNLALTGGGVD